MSTHVKSKEAEPKQPVDEQLHKGLEDTFPASDPPASTQPGSGRKKAVDTQNPADAKTAPGQ